MLIAAAFFGLLGLGMLIYGLLRGRDPELLARTIAAELQKEEFHDPYVEKLKQPVTQRVVLPALRAVGEYLAGIAPSGLMAK